MVTDRWKKEKTPPGQCSPPYVLSIEFETEWMDEVDQAAVATTSKSYRRPGTKLRKETEEYEEGRKAGKKPLNTRSADCSSGRCSAPLPQWALLEK
jgi:hypothetical protein